MTDLTNNPPIITSNSGNDTAAISIAENTTAVTTITSTDAENDTVTYSISGDDAAKFNVDSATGALTFANAPDFETPTDTNTDNVYNVIVTATDGNLTDSQSIAITVTDVVEGTTATNTAPVLSSNPVTIGFADTVINDTFAASSGTFTATDAENDTLSYVITDGTVTDGVSTLTNAYGSLAITTATGEYVFTPNATAINALTTDATTTFSIVANDGKDNSTPQTFTVNLTAANDQPVLNSGASFTGTFNATAPTGAVGTLVSNLVKVSNVTDRDSGAVYGLAMTATDSNGSWFYSTDNGANWVTVGEVSATSALLLAADANTRVYFQPNAAYFVGAAKFDFKAWDTTAGTAVSTIDTTIDNNAISVESNSITVNVAPTGNAELYKETADNDTGFTIKSGSSSANGVNTITDGTAAAGTSPSGFAYTHYKTGLFGTLYVATGKGMGGGPARKGAYKFEPDAAKINSATQDTNEVFTINNTTAGTSDAVTIYVAGVNDQPILDASKSPIFNTQIINAGTPSGTVGTLISALVDLSSVASGIDNVSDADANTQLGIAITAVNANNSGSLLYSVDGGTNWKTVNAVSDAGALLLKADANTRLYFQSNQDYAGTINDIVTFKVWDQSAGSADSYVDTTTGTQFSAVSDTIAVAIIDDKPPVFANSAVTISYTDTAGNNVFSSQTGKFTATDEDTNDVLTFGIASGISGVTTINGVDYDLSKVSAYGTLYLKSTTGDYVFEPVASAINALTTNATQAFTVTVNDGKITAEQTFTVSLTGANDSPVLDDTKSLTMKIPFNGAVPSGAVGSLVSSFANNSNVTDADAGALFGVAITATDNTHGTWYYSTNNGADWSAIGDVSAENALLLAADANSCLYLDPTDEYIGSSSFAFKAWDQSAGVAGNKLTTVSNEAVSSLSDSVAVSIEPTVKYAVYADTAAIDSFTPATGGIAQGQLKKLSSTLTNFSSPLVVPVVNGVSTYIDAQGATQNFEWTGDGAATLYSLSGLNYTLSLTGKYGTLYAQKGVDTNNSSSVPYAYVPNNEAVNALPFSASYFTDEFNVAGIHRPNASGTIYQDTLKIFITSANDAPALTADKTTLAEGISNSPYTISTTDLLQGYSDIDAGDTLAVANLTVPANQGTLSNPVNGVWTFTPVTDFSGNVNLSYEVVDSSNAKIAATQTFTVFSTPLSPVSLMANLQSTLINKPFEYSSPKFSPDGNFTATLPNWLTIDAQTGVLTGTPTVADLGTFDIQISRNGETDSLTLMVAPFKTGHLHTGETGSAGLDTVTYYNATSAVTATIANTTENMVGSGFADNLTGNNKANVLDGGAGADTLAGITGNDTYLVDDVGDVIVENTNEGTDTVLSLVDYTLPANIEKLTLLDSANLSVTGNELNNLIIGNAGNNTLAGGGGIDTLKGGFGDDVYLVDSATVSIVESVKQGVDSVNATVSFVLPRNVENLTLLGSDNLNGTGNTLNNILQGNSGNNLLIGGSGKDVLIGGSGNDVLNGGSGIDTAIFDSAFSAYQFTRSTDSDGLAFVQVASQTETDDLYSVEFVQFAGDETARSLISIIGS